jgi:hypothetical protein
MRLAVYTLAITALFLSQSGSAIGQTFTWGIGPQPHSTVSVTNSLDRNYVVEVVVADRSQGFIPVGGNLSHPYGFANGGSLQVQLNICRGIGTRDIFARAPEWARSEKNGALAITDAYLATNPSRPALKARIKQLNESIKNELARKPRVIALNQWFDRVNQTGISFQAKSCTGLVETFTENVFIPPYQYRNSVATMIVRGNETAGFRIEQPGYVANY